MSDRESLIGEACVKGGVLEAHLSWADRELPGGREAVAGRLDGGNGARVRREGLATEWVPLSQMVAIDRAIAAEAGGHETEIFRVLGRHSAELNLGGVYKSFVVDEPHRFFEQMALLHRRFMNFGRSVYEQDGERSGRIRLEDYPEYSPVLCASARGYYEGALDMMKVPGPIRVAEVTCRCSGDECCVFYLAW